MRGKRRLPPLLALPAASLACAAWSSDVPENCELDEVGPHYAERVEGASLISSRQVMVRNREVGRDLHESEDRSASEAVMLETRGSAKSLAAGAGTELPGQKDRHGPDALGENSTTQVSRTAKWILVVAVMIGPVFPVVMTLYFLICPGDYDYSARVQEEHGGAVPFAVQRAALTVYRVGWVFFRLAMFVVYFWFGFLKMVEESPAEPLVQLVYREMPFGHVSSATFFCKWFVGISECAMGLCYLATVSPLPGVRFWATACALTLGVGHVTMVSLLPMALLPHEVWQKDRFPYALTFEGQYIMKNLVLISGVMLMAHDLVKPEDRDQNFLRKGSKAALERTSSSRSSSSCQHQGK